MNNKKLIKRKRDKQMTYEEIGKSMGISRQRVYQIHNDYEATSEHIRGVRKELDNRECVICDSKDKLQVHHINGVKKDNAMINLVTLCYTCHLKVGNTDRLFKRKNPRFPLKLGEKIKVINFAIYKLK